MTFSGRRGWSQAKSSLTTKFDGRVTIPLADVLERVVQLQAQVEELTRIVTAQVDVGNQTTELLGRLLATASGRLDAVEDSLQALGAPGTPSSAPGAERPGRAKTATKGSSGSEDKQ